MSNLLEGFSLNRNMYFSVKLSSGNPWKNPPYETHLRGSKKEETSSLKITLLLSDVTTDKVVRRIFF